MAFGFPAYHTERYSPVSSSDDIRKAVREALIALSWPIKEETSDHIGSSVKVNVRSFGEKIQINFLPDNSISITSKCGLPTQCQDWGKNKKNVETFINELKKRGTNVLG